MSKSIVNIFCYFTILNFLNRCLTFNIDVKYPIFFESNEADYFGYSVGLLKNRDGQHALITAPRANSSILKDQLHNPGVLRKCKISLTSPTQKCTEVLLDQYGNTITRKEPNFSYKDKKDDMFLGVSLDIQQNTKNNKVVVCGHLWKNQVYPKHYLANGVCYVINSELDPNTVKKLLPLINKEKQFSTFIEKQSLIPPGIYYYAFGQVGASAAFSEDGKYLFLGAPGFYDWAGTVISYQNPAGNGNYTNPIIPDPIELPGESYIGYSLTSGKFFRDSETFIAAGGPRDKATYGQVYITKVARPRVNKFIVHMKKEGTQFGEYYGAAILGVNLNMDAFTDLLVGAPFHSSLSGGDEGKVYVYISNGVGLQAFTELTGENIPNARFGTCISNIGDINQDGYNDVAVGAPYENNKGAVYIYHGTQAGINNQYSQRLEASKISPSLSGFGISISRGLDIDENYYPDILIGSYDSSQAVLFRSHPVVRIAGKLDFFPQQINMNVTSCEIGGENVTCFDVTTCLYYTGKHGQLNLTFETELYIDYSRHNGRPRSFLVSDGMISSVIRRKIEVHIGKDECLTDKAYIQADAKDVITPIDFSFVFKLEENMEDKFCSTCPLIDKNINTNNITKSISFQTGCGTDNQCFADLVVNADVMENPGNLPLIIGQNSTLTINIRVTNEAEPAYISELLIHLPPELGINNQGICSKLSEQQKQEMNATLLCEIGNPLSKDKPENIQIKIDISKIPSNTKSSSIFIHAKTGSIETNPEDNSVELVINFRSLADIHITGPFDHELIQYDDGRKKPLLIKHTYFVMNHGPSPVEVIGIDLYIPTALKIDDNLATFVSLVDVESDSGEPLTIPATCNLSSIELKPIKSGILKSTVDIFNEKDLVAPEINNRTFRRSISSKDVNPDDNILEPSSHPLKETSAVQRKNYVIDCETAHCTIIHCVASPFIDTKKFAKLNVIMQLNVSALDDILDPWHRLEFFTSGVIYIKGDNIDIQPEPNYPDEISVRTILIHPGPLSPEEIKMWIIYVSVGVGALLLILILIILIKIGFFKRQQKEKMRKMMTNADLKEWEPYLITNDLEVNAEEIAND